MTRRSKIHDNWRPGSVEQTMRTCTCAEPLLPLSPYPSPSVCLLIFSLYSFPSLSCFPQSSLPQTGPSIILLPNSPYSTSHRSTLPSPKCPTTTQLSLQAQAARRLLMASTNPSPLPQSWQLTFCGEAVGLEPPDYWVHTSTPNLLYSFWEVASLAKLTFIYIYNCPGEKL